MHDPLALSSGAAARLGLAAVVAAAIWAATFWALQA